MRPIQQLAIAATALSSFVLLAAAPAAAKCTRLGFSVNDYGKDGPTKDAQALLDKHIAAKMEAQGVKKYTVGKKTVNCELFLNFIVFDEHTCTAEATVCWDGQALPASEQVKAGAPVPAPASKSAATAPAVRAKSEAAPAAPKAPLPQSAPAEKAAEPAKAALSAPVVTVDRAAAVPLTPAPVTTGVQSDAPENATGAPPVPDAVQADSAVPPVPASAQ